MCDGKWLWDPQTSCSKREFKVQICQKINLILVNVNNKLIDGYFFFLSKSKECKMLQRMEQTNSYQNVTCTQINLLKTNRNQIVFIIFRLNWS